MPLPPRWVRRVLLAPGVVLLAVVLVTTLPVWALLAAALSPLVPGRLRPLRLLWIGCVYLVWDAAALLALFGLWVAAGFGARQRSPGFQRAHYLLAGWFLRVLFWQARWTLRLRIDVVGTDPDTALPGRPELVLCRHAGPGDSFILIHALVNWFRREPRIVLKESLQWDPAIDVLLNRLPSRFIAPPRDGDQGEELLRQIGHLATALDDDDAFVIFPEGGNFTPRRRLRAIARLRSAGLERMARRPSGCGTCSHHGRAGCWPRWRRRRRPGSSSSRTPGWTDAHRHRRVAGTADGQADRDAVLVGAPGGGADRPAGTHRLALRLVGADRRVDRGQP